MSRTQRKTIDEALVYDVAPNGCWIVRGSKTKFGHKGFTRYLNGVKTQLYAHREMYKKYVGPIPDGAMVCHKCDRPDCIRPDHLFLGNATINQEDCVLKDRRPQAILTVGQVVDILLRWPAGMTIKQVAIMYGVGHNTMQQVRYGYSWKAVRKMLNLPLTGRIS